MINVVILLLVGLYCIWVCKKYVFNKESSLSCGGQCGSCGTGCSSSQLGKSLKSKYYRDHPKGS